MMNPPFYNGQHGLFFHKQDETISLSLNRVRVSAVVQNLSAIVHITQEYENQATGFENGECSYTFPVPARAAVCQFSMTRQDGTRVLGIVKEKYDARMKYDEAIAKGQLASLMEQQTPDIFRVIVGNIKAQEKVTIQLTYVTEITEDEENDSIRFHVPAHIGNRYGEPPADKPDSSSDAHTLTTTNTFFDLTTTIKTIAPIRKISCPTHKISIEYPPNETDSGDGRHQAIVSFASSSKLEKDFILAFQSSKLDSPLCMAELSSSNQSTENDTATTAGLYLSFVPKFNLPDIPNQEYIFLVDRSGSMGAFGADSETSRVSLAKKALIVLLRSLPRKGTEFNIVSFGSHHSLLWESGCKEYNQDTLQQATTLVDGMEADFGGTEMESALKASFASRNRKKPTSVFVLTDGDTYDLAGVQETVRKAVSSSDKGAELRLFVLAIGNSASTAMCEGIARAGNGATQYVVDGESFTGKTARLLKAAKTPLISNIRLEYGKAFTSLISHEPIPVVEHDDFEMVELPSKETGQEAQINSQISAPSSMYDESVDPLKLGETGPASPEISLSPPAALQQSPGIIRTLYPGTRVHVCAILSAPSSLTSIESLLPQSIVLRGDISNSGSSESTCLELVVPVHFSPRSAEDTTAPIHTLAARKIIQDLEDGQHVYTGIEDKRILEQTVKAAIIRLGLKYSITSQHTSFLAIDESQVGNTPVKHAVVTVENALPPYLPSAHASRSFSRKLLAAPGCPRPTFSASRMDTARRAHLGGGGPPSGTYPAPIIGGGYALLPPSPAVASPEARGRKSNKAQMGGLVTMTTSALHESESKSDLNIIDLCIPLSQQKPENRLDSLARLQEFDGSFKPQILELCQVLPRTKKERLEVGEEQIGLSSKLKKLLCTDSSLYGTLVALVVWERDFKGERESWEGMSEKAKEFVQSRLTEEGETSVEETFEVLLEAVKQSMM